MPKPSLTFIDQGSVKTDFEQHINDGSNKRILFSARFGTGKSTFLNSFFEENNKYITLKLYPVNYSIAHNKDVFELIKYDLIYELLSKYPNEINLQKEDYSTALIGQMFILHNLKIEPLLKSILKAVKPGSESFISIFDEIQSISNDFKAHKDEVSAGESDLLLKYIKNLKAFKGSAHEYDDISELISTMLERVKTSTKSEENNSTTIKETVLIIDDLDRLDPEHVFRLFNIFSAHYDSVNQENKFGFDKVIFVCDYDNIRLMYEHRYGKGVDFSGYIDKFFSTDVFLYDNRKYVLNALEKIFKEKSQNIPQKFQDKYLPVNSPLYKAFEYILISLFEINVISLRSLEQFICYDTPPFKISAGQRKSHYTSSEFPFLMLIHLLKKLFSLVDLRKHLETLAKRFEATSGNLNTISYPEHIEKYLIEESLMFIIDQNIIFNNNNVNENEKRGSVMVNKKIANFSLSENHRNGYRFISLDNVTDESNHSPNKIERPNVFDYLISALEKSENLTIVD
ncbi:P-loop NTPase fold protein [Mucilaginibacter sp. RCC_168]|uniref:P-loop NTPase fold protein n=1 Tax=Mucilaginibacter sp. RCC_168 TaxID=3239221 RepID=UPI003525DE41